MTDGEKISHKNTKEKFIYASLSLFLPVFRLPYTMVMWYTGASSIHIGMEVIVICSLDEHLKRMQMNVFNK